VGADKILAQPTSWCRRTESILSLERAVCSCAKLQVFSCYRDWKEACQATCTISATSRRELSSSLFFLQGKAPKEIHTILTETLGAHAPSRRSSNWFTFSSNIITSMMPGFPKWNVPFKLTFEKFGSII